MFDKLYKMIKVIVIIGILGGIVAGNFTIAFILLFTLLLFLLSDLLKKIIGYSDYLHFLIYFFILSTEVLGDIFSFYDKISFFDIVIHSFSGFIVASLSIYILRLFYNESSRKLIIVFILSFSMAVASLWEICEFSIDKLLDKDMQKDSVITEFTSSLLSSDVDSPSKIVVDNASLNNIDLVKKYGGYIDIGLYDTIFDMIAALFGTCFYIIYKKSEAI